MEFETEKALVIFSGGQDSAIVLAWALENFSSVETVGFEYGQRHEIELKARQTIRDKYQTIKKEWAARLGNDHVLDLVALGQISDTAMTREVEITKRDDGLPTTFVPGRNLAFLVMASALAIGRNASYLVAGMCETDFSGYPDCRQDVLDLQMDAICTGMVCTLDLKTPLMAMSKAESWTFAHSLGGDELVEIIRRDTHTCYLGERKKDHGWGYGCGVCPACVLRAQGWNSFCNEKKA